MFPQNDVYCRLTVFIPSFVEVPPELVDSLAGFTLVFDIVLNGLLHPVDCIVKGSTEFDLDNCLVEMNGVDICESLGPKGFAF